MGELRNFLDNLSREELIERMQLALEGSGLGVWDWDPRDGSVQFDRQWCEMLGLDHASVSMELSTWESRVHPDDLADCYRDIQAHMCGETERYENVHRMRHAAGHWVYILDQGRIAARDADGRPSRFTGTHVDITELVTRRASEERERRNAELGRVAGGVAHEVNTPLQLIEFEAALLAEALQEPMPDAAEMTRGVWVIAETVQKLAGIVCAMRSRLGDGRAAAQRPSSQGAMGCGVSRAWPSGGELTHQGSTFEEAG